MRVAVLCEYSGTVRDAFTRLGHYAISCDLLDTESPGPHIKGDCLSVDWSDCDLVICHPPCTHLAVSGAAHFWRKKEEQKQALEFVRELMFLPVPMIALENPKSVISSYIRKADQIIHPWQFGHGETKETHLWLKGLPKLKPTNVVSGREQRIHKLPPTPDRWKLRSKTYTGIAEAMAVQWSRFYERSLLRK